MSEAVDVEVDATKVLWPNFRDNFGSMRAAGNTTSVLPYKTYIDVLRTLTTLLKQLFYNILLMEEILYQLV